MPEKPTTPEDPNGSGPSETEKEAPDVAAEDPGEKAAPPPPPVEIPEAPDSGYVSPNRSLMIVLAYLGILALIPLLAEKRDSEVQWHAKHGIVLLVAWIVVAVVASFLMFIPILGWILGCGVFLLPLVALGLHIYLILQALNGKRVEIPLITAFANQWK